MLNSSGLMPRIAIYPGSFDPPTNGHLDIIERASTLFDTLVVAVGTNSEKSPFMSVNERMAALNESTTHLQNVRIDTFKGLLVKYAQDQGSRVLVRGLRAISDFDYEFRVSMANKNLAPEIETVFLIAKEEYSFIASSVVKEMAQLGADFSKFVPGPVAERMAKILAERPED
ncbi:MAG: pantetheine-phosphate adenylyltransferase [Fimbriimonadaceae bacterium]|nr:pantetheine-phosphate adenylyltransferase [Fimbriimonadaceae bacterium]